jgi:chromosome segregation ATPase
MQDEDIESITNHLQQLTLQQEQLTKQIAELNTELRRINNNKQQSVPTKQRTSRRKTSIEVGDKVRVINPKRNQPNTGTVTSFTTSGLFARIELDNGTIIRRSPGNLRKYE